MRAELPNLDDSAAPFLSRAAVNLCWYYYTVYIILLTKTTAALSYHSVRYFCGSYFCGSYFCGSYFCGEDSNNMFAIITEYHLI